jgi:hypothetical protein
MVDNDYVIVEDVFILDEHQMKIGDKVIDINEQKLQDIADRNNRRIHNTGDEIPLIIGHTKDGADEKDQPEVVGYASNLRVKDFMNTGKKAIAATFKYHKASADLAKKFPRRSVELWTRDWKLDPIALLGATTPERDLGLVRFKRKGPRKYSRVLPMTGTQDTNEIVAGVVAALQQSDVWQFVQSQMRANQGMEMGIDDSLLPTNEEDDSLLPEEEMGLEEEVPMEEGEEGLEEEVPEEEATGVEGEDPDAVEEEPEEKEPVRMNRQDEDDVKVRLSRVEKENGDLVAKLSAAEVAVQEIKLKYQRAQRDAELMGLENEGYLFDRKEELDHVSNLSEEAYASHINIIKKRYQRAPVGGATFNPAKDAVKEVKGRGKEDMAAIAKLALDKGISYEAALAQHSS